MFRSADLMLMTKTDLLDVLDDVDTAKAKYNRRQLASNAPVLELSARRGQGIENWTAWLNRQVAAQIARIKKGASLKPAVQPDASQLHTQGISAQHAILHPQV